MPRLRKIYWVIMLAGLVLTAVGVQAGGSSFRLSKNSRVAGIIASDGKTYDLENTNPTKDYFVPNVYPAEWIAFKTAADTYLDDIIVTEVVPKK